MEKYNTQKNNKIIYVKGNEKMKIINTKNFMKVNESNDFIIEDDKISKIKVLENEEFLIDRIPCIQTDNSKIYMLTKITSLYVILSEKTQTYAVKIKTDLTNNGEPTITEICTTLKVDNSLLLSDYIEYSKETTLKMLINKLPLIMFYLPFSGKEIGWYEDEINKFHIKLNTEKKVEKKVEAKPKVINYTNFGKTYIVDGQEYTLNELSKKFNIRNDTLKARLKKGMDLEEALTTPVQNTGWRIRK